MEFSAGQIAAMIKGTVQGNANVQVKGFGKIETAKSGQLSFLANSKYAFLISFASDPRSTPNVLYKSVISVYSNKCGLDASDL
jgi:hypothetical protein